MRDMEDPKQFANILANRIRLNPQEALEAEDVILEAMNEVLNRSIVIAKDTGKWAAEALEFERKKLNA